MQAGILSKAIDIFGFKATLMAAAEQPLPSASFRRPGGERLAYDEYGSPQGFPLFYFHDAGSSRLECGFFHKAARLNGYRLIAIDRPGIGCSDYYPVRSAADFCRDVVCLADMLQLQKFGVLSLGAGSVYGITLSHMQPQRVSLFLSLAGVPGVAFAEATPPSFLANCLHELTPGCVKVMTRLRHMLLRDDPEQVIARMQEVLSVADRKMLFTPRIRQLQLRDIHEAVRNGSRGVAQDLGVSHQKLEFQLSDVVTPGFIWRGAADRISSRADCEYLVARMPNVRYHQVANGGHFFFVHCMNEVFSRCRFNQEHSAEMAA